MCGQANKHIEELNEQVRDLMFFMEGRKALEANTDVLAGGGRVTIPKDGVPKPPKATSGKKKKKK